MALKNENKKNLLHSNAKIITTTTVFAVVSRSLTAKSNVAYTEENYLLRTNLAILIMLAILEKKEI